MKHYISIVAAVAAILKMSVALAQSEGSGNSGSSSQIGSDVTNANNSRSDGGSLQVGKLTKPPKLVHYEPAPLPASHISSLGPVSVNLELGISVEGKVELVEVIESAGEPYDTLAKEAVSKFIFEAAEIDDKPTGVRLKYRFVFEPATSSEPLKAATKTSFGGIVRDKISAKPLAGVKVRIDGSGAEATTSEDGRFYFESLDIGKHSVLLLGSSFTPVGTEETLEANTKYDVVYDVELQIERVSEEDKADFELVVLASKLSKRVESVVVNSEQASKVAGTGGDAIKVVENLPGVARSSVGSGALVVWGAGTADTRVYVEGVHVPVLYHEGGFRSVIHSDLVKNVELEPGGYGASYGRGLGGLVTVGYRPLEANGIHGSAAVDIIDAAASVRGNVGNKVRYAIAVRKSHLDKVLSAVASDDVGEFVPIPKYWDGQIRIAYVPTPQQSIEFGTLSSSDRISRSFIQSDPLDTKTELKSSGFHRVYVSYKKQADDGSLVSIVPFFGTNRRHVESRFGGVPAELTTHSNLFGLRASWYGAVAEKLFGLVGIDGELDFTSLNRQGSVTTPPREGDIRVFGQIPDDQVNADSWRTTIVGIAPYAQLDWSLVDGRLHIIPGVRFEPSLRGGSRYTPPEGEIPAIGYQEKDAFIEPRFALRYSLSEKVMLRAATGLYHQPPLAEDMSPVFGNPRLGAGQAWHYLIGGQVQVAEGLSVEATAFFSQQRDLVTRSQLSSPALAQALVQDGRGRAYGGQLMLRKELTKRLFGWVSYSLIRSERDDGKSTKYRPFDFDQTHVFTALASYDLGKGFEVGSRFRFSTGYPRTDVVGATYDARVDGYQPLFGMHNDTRIPSFYQLDARIAKTFKLGKTSWAEVYLDVQNVTNQKNPEEIVYNYNYSKKSYITGLPLLPVVGGKLSW
jgi:TonB dependent receptor/TonB-dependent Receptor Plug Domain